MSRCSRSRHSNMPDVHPIRASSTISFTSAGTVFGSGKSMSGVASSPRPYSMKFSRSSKLLRFTFRMWFTAIRYSHVRKLLLSSNVESFVVSIVRPVQHPQGNVVDPGLMPDDQPFERVTAAGLSATDQHLVFGVGFGLIGKRVYHRPSYPF